jgi:hypothetical protein|nr:MAG TPA: hypothetical protein [Crassvirales sp.]
MQNEKILIDKKCDYLSEYIKALTDKDYFIKNYVKIKGKK